MSFRLPPARRVELVYVLAALALAAPQPGPGARAQLPGPDDKRTGIGLATRAPAAAPDANGARIQLDSDVWDFKDVEYGAPCEHVFKITNHGRATLVITSAVASCGCTVPTLKRKDIPPGQSEDLHVTYDSFRRGPFEKLVTVTSNDDARPRVALTIKGNIVSDVNVSPLHGVYWMNPVPREDAGGTKQRVTLTTSRLPQLVVRLVECDNPHLEWKLVDGPDARTRYLDLGFRKGTPAGEFNASLRIYTNGGKDSILVVPVHATIQGDIILSPEHLYFPVSKEGKLQEAEFSVNDRKERGDLELKSASDLGGCLVVRVREVQHGRQYKVTAGLRPDFRKSGVFYGSILLRTNRAGDDSVKIDYSGYVEPTVQPANVKR